MHELGRCCGSYSRAPIMCNAQLYVTLQMYSLEATLGPCIYLSLSPKSHSSPEAVISPILGALQLIDFFPLHQAVSIHLSPRGLRWVPSPQGYTGANRKLLVQL